MRVYCLFIFRFVFFLRGDRIEPVAIECRERDYSKGEIAILFSIVGKPNNYVSGRLNPPQSLGEGLQVTNFDHCLHILMVIGKCTDVFRRTFSC